MAANVSYIHLLIMRSLVVPTGVGTSDESACHSSHRSGNDFSVFIWDFKAVIRVSISSHDSISWIAVL
jgi:hypothetical protein